MKHEWRYVNQTHSYHTHRCYNCQLYCLSKLQDASDMPNSVCGEPDMIGMEIEGLGRVTGVDWRDRIFYVAGTVLPFASYSPCAFPRQSELPAASASDERFPHTCPRCGKPAYVGFNSIDCSECCT